MKAAYIAPEEKRSQHLIDWKRKKEGKRTRRRKKRQGGREIKQFMVKYVLACIRLVSFDERYFETASKYL